MGIFNRKKPVAQPEAGMATQVGIVRNAFDPLAGRALGLRKGSWVKVNHGNENKVGILTGLTGSGYAIVMLTDKDGCNLIEITCAAGSVYKAKAADIPAKRCTPERARQLGYV